MDPHAVRTDERKRSPLLTLTGESGVVCWRCRSWRAADQLRGEHAYAWNCSSCKAWNSTANSLERGDMKREGPSPLEIEKNSLPKPAEKKTPEERNNTMETTAKEKTNGKVALSELIGRESSIKLGLEIGVSPHTIQRIRNGKRISLEKATKIAKFYGKDIADVSFRHGERGQGHHRKKVVVSESPKAPAKSVVPARLVDVVQLLNNLDRHQERFALVDTKTLEVVRFSEGR